MRNLVKLANVDMEHPDHHSHIVRVSLKIDIRWLQLGSVLKAAGVSLFSVQAQGHQQIIFHSFQKKVSSNLYLMDYAVSELLSAWKFEQIVEN